MIKCNTEIPHNKQGYKKCVNKKFMGGHKNSFINHYNNNIVYCGKLINSNEYIFYNYLEKNKKIKKYFPNFYGLCNKDKKIYIIIENIFKNLKSDFKFVDIKIGHKTAYKEDSGRIKSFRHDILDKYFSTSTKEGFRIEGLNFKINKKFINTKLKRHTITPLDLWKSLLYKSSTKTTNKLVIKLKEMLNMLYINLFNKNKFAFIGASVLIAHDNNKVVIKLIDFTHSFFGSNNFNNKLAKDLYFGVLNLYQSLLYYKQNLK